MEVYAENCSFPGCNKVDFLPFKCDACSRLYCLEHRSYQAHACPEAKSKDFTVVICPDCKKGLRVPASETDLDGVLTKHKQTECPGKKKVDRCAVCKCKLTLTNRFECPHCGKMLCLKHRFEEEHDCVPLASRGGPPFSAGPVPGSSLGGAGGAGGKKNANGGKKSAGGKGAKNGQPQSGEKKKRKGLFCCFGKDEE
mmetsp:Transcript_13436/g.32955  ORF Transcript_13436/g.32955 Transcript_13436/m.32955 type:complete len:197 (+) Transcript_13436:270-860(+)|eukprot:CAMPEP_0178998116 /NCGR_PEP_ID=MMETSP0795-20121207/9347_1 /TAXON_ID=88552 /ORGANISM="Amoebophrya sp., Strain Ameob2" /LENGTH=196 /DNA_ID=CAMNT_0020690785 /DNA_START=205 /DNA_END=795 /DNA_ORIENTATION=+